MEKVKLYNGLSIPAIWYGPGVIHANWEKNMLSDTSLKNLNKLITEFKLYQTLSRAMTIEDIAIDTASAYGDAERIIGNIIRKSKKDTIFLSSKISNRSQRRESANIALRRTLSFLHREIIDLYLIHWPQPGYEKTWKQMEELYKEGYVRAIGVCNFQIHHLEELMKVAEIKPMVNQIEVHPLFSQKELCSYCEKRGIQVMAYTPTARCDDRIMNDSKINRIARKYGKSVVQIMLRWHYQNNHISVVNTAKIEHLVQNVEIFKFKLLQSEMDYIDGLNIESRLRYDSDNCNFKDL